MIVAFPGNIYVYAFCVVFSEFRKGTFETKLYISVALVTKPSSLFQKIHSIICSETSRSFLDIVKMACYDIQNVSEDTHFLRNHKKER